MSAALLITALRDPSAVRPDWDWTGLIAAARAEQIIGSLAYRLEGAAVPERVETLLAMHRADAAQKRVQALWEAEMTRRALAPIDVPVVVLKGTAFLAANLEAGIGRSTGDLDILVPRGALDAVEQALLDHGWERMKEADGYDDLYYRQWMHELPPLIHRERDRMIDVHHTILPLTARPKPDAEALLAASVALPDGLRRLNDADLIVHAAAHLIADGDMAGGVRNLWDIDRLVRQFSAERGDAFTAELGERARLHGLTDAVARALRLTRALYGTPVDDRLAGKARLSDRAFLRRLTVRNGWGQEGRVATRGAFYLRGHFMRMPPLMLARHLATKALGPSRG